MSNNNLIKPNSELSADNGTKPNVGGSYLYKRMMQIINNPEPISKPPYSCPMSAYGKSKDCQFPNCTCEWQL